MCDERTTRRSLARLGVVGALGGELLLDADPAWAGAINTALVTKGVRVSELCRPQKDVTLAGAKFHKEKQ